jgi:hypothetical protein
LCKVEERISATAVFFLQPGKTTMRACFLGQNVTALGFGFAMLQTPPLPEPEPEKKPEAAAAEPPRPPPAQDPEAA